MQAWGRRLRTVVVVDDLRSLRGPLTGVHTLPRHLDCSARHAYDFADPQWRDLAYRTVLMEAGSAQDLTTWLDRDALVQLWPQLYLPAFVRHAWQAQHPNLARAAAFRGAAAADSGVSSSAGVGSASPPAA